MCESDGAIYVYYGERDDGVQVIVEDVDVGSPHEAHLRTARQRGNLLMTNDCATVCKFMEMSEIITE